MPNWCQNRVTAYARNGNEQDIKRIQEIFESKDTVFGKIIPSPDWNNTPNNLILLKMDLTSCMPDNL